MLKKILTITLMGIILILQLMVLQNQAQMFKLQYEQQHEIWRMSRVLKVIVEK